MACFIVPAVEAVVATIAVKIIEKKEKNISAAVSVSKEPFSKKLKRLNGLLWGGSVLLAFEHFVTAVWGVMTLVMGKFSGKADVSDFKESKGEPALK